MADVKSNLHRLYGKQGDLMSAKKSLIGQDGLLSNRKATGFLPDKFDPRRIC
jgi:hypothetical protein